MYVNTTYKLTFNTLYFEDVGLILLGGASLRGQEVLKNTFWTSVSQGIFRTYSVGVVWTT